jgi:GH15 family glucan-1,4-alpha-glucosidase
MTTGTLTSASTLDHAGAETAIADHGLIGDLQTAALVTTDGSIDWLCLPRFDSPSVFGALLDAERGGHCRMRPAGTDFTAKQAYLPDSALLVTRFFTPPAWARSSTSCRLPATPPPTGTASCG